MFKMFLAWKGATALISILSVAVASFVAFTGFQNRATVLDAVNTVFPIHAGHTYSSTGEFRPSRGRIYLGVSIASAPTRTPRTQAIGRIRGGTAAWRNTNTVTHGGTATNTFFGNQPATGMMNFQMTARQMNNVNDAITVRMVPFRR